MFTVRCAWCGKQFDNIHGITAYYPDGQYRGLVCCERCFVESGSIGEKKAETRRTEAEQRQTESLIEEARTLVAQLYEKKDNGNRSPRKPAKNTRKAGHMFTISG